MKNRLIALLLTLALVVTVSVFAVSANEPATADLQVSSDLTVAADGKTATGYCPHCQKDVTWTAFTPAASGHMAMNSGHYFLNNDTAITANGAFRANKNADVVLHLNGKTYKRNGSTGVIMQNGANTKFSIVDGTAGLGTLENVGNGPAISFPDGYKGTNETITLYSGNLKGDPDVTANGGAVQMLDATATCIFNMYGGTLTGKSTVLGGAIYGAAKDQVNLYGGTITGSGSRGGAVYLTGTNAKLTVDGATITGSTATDRGGSVALLAGASMEMKSGTIENGYCWGNQMGGNIYAEGNVTVSGGTITGGNTTGTANTPSTKGAAANIKGAGRGGNICIRGAYTLKVTGGTISDGVSPSGGNISIEGTKTDHVLSGGTISGGEALNGGNIYIAADTPGGTFSGTTVKDGIVYVSSSSNGRGGNLYNTTGTFNITGGSFEGGAIKGTKTSSNTGFGANIMTQKNMTITNATISGGNAENSFGGNLGVHGGATVTLGQGGVITNGTALRATGNSANGQGGNVYVLNGTFTVAGGTVSNTTNAANAQHAGNIYLPSANSNLNMTSGSITGGNVTSYGGNIYAYTNSTVNITGGTISGGKASQGGNVYIRATKNVTLKDCEVTGGTGYSIYLMDAAAGATLNGATVSGATAGAIYNTGTLTLTNATISGNSRASAAGIQNLAGATVTMTGGSISGNTATTTSYTATAAGANVYNAGTFNMISGTIENGIAQNSYKLATGETAKVLAKGGNVYNTGTFIMTSGTISGGKAQRSGQGNNQAQGGNIYNAGTFTMADGTITGGNAVTKGGNVIIVGTADAAATFTMEKGTISEGNSAGNQGGVAVNDYGTFTMNGGLIDNNDSVYSGGNIAVQGTNAVLDINGGTISNGDATSTGTVKGNAGNILVSTGGTATIDNATISGGTAAGNGGNLIVEGTGTAAVANTKILNGHSIGMGGNVVITNTGASCSFTGCEITGGVAGTKNTEGEGEEETIITPTTDGRGGNIAMNVNTTFTNCVIRNGESWGTANPGGGNVYIYGGTNQILDGCTITGGQAWQAGGNIVLHGTPTLYIQGDSYIAGGISYNNWGGNIGYTNAAKLYLEGNTIVDGAEAYCKNNNNIGNNIGMSPANVNVSHELHVQDHAVIKNGEHKDMAGTNVTRPSVAVVAGTDESGTLKHPIITLSGNANVDKILVRTYTSQKSGDITYVFDQYDNIVVIEEGYTGAVTITTDKADYNNQIVPGNAVHAAVAINGYANTGSVKVQNNSGSGFITIVDAGVLKVAGITGFKQVDPDSNPETDNSYVVETGFATLDEVKDAGYAYAKLYQGGTYTLSAKTDNFPIDLNNQIVTFNTGDYKLHAIDYRTDGIVADTTTGGAKYTQLTVDNDENVVLLTRNPINGYQYLNVKGTHLVDENNCVDMKTPKGEETEKTFWTSNRIQVEMTKVSIKTLKDGIYYRTKIATNANASPYLDMYGTAVTLKENVRITNGDFLNLDNEHDTYAEDNGIMFTKHTVTDKQKAGGINETVNSALIVGILKEGEDNNTRCEINMHANSYVVAVINDESVVIMADEYTDQTMKQVMIKLDEKIEELNRLQPEDYEKTIATAVAFYNKWPEFATWTKVNSSEVLLPNLKAEAEKAA